MRFAEIFARDFQSEWDLAPRSPRRASRAAEDFRRSRGTRPRARWLPRHWMPRSHRRRSGRPRPTPPAWPRSDCISAPSSHGRPVLRDRARVLATRGDRTRRTLRTRSTRRPCRCSHGTIYSAPPSATAASPPPASFAPVLSIWGYSRRRHGACVRPSHKPPRSSRGYSASRGVMAMPPIAMTKIAVYSLVQF